MGEPPAVAVKINCPACGKELDVTGQPPFSIVPCPQCGTQLTVPQRLGHFLLISELGSGGIGSVYRALDTSLGRYVAVKLLKQELAQDSTFIADFSREAQAAAALNHPNIAQVYSFGVQDNQYYLVMELVERGSLDDLIEKRKRLSEIETLEYGIQIASALRAAYQRGVIHRDVKPGNVLISSDGTLKLVDFGLAKFRDAEHAGDHPEGILATPYYIAPEKLHGKTGDFRSDMYSLGGTLFHFVAGRPPFEAPTATDVVQKNLTADALSLKTFAPDISEATALLIARLLRKDPEERYPDYDELIHDLELAKRLATQHALTLGGRERPARTKIGTALTAAAWILLVGATIYFVRKADWSQFLKRPEPPVEITPPKTPPPPIDTPTITAPVDLRRNFAKGHQMLNVANFPSAIAAYSEARSDLKDEPDDRNWSELMLGITHLLAGEPQKAATAMESLTASATPEAPATITYELMPASLAMMLTGKLALTAFGEREATLPPWGRAAVLLTRGAKEFGDGGHENAAKTFKAYLEVARADEHAWLFEFRGITSKFNDEISAVLATVEKVKQLQQDGQFDTALFELRKSKANIHTAPQLQQYLSKLEPELQQLEQKRRAEAYRKQEEEKKRLKAEERAKVEAEKKLVNDADAVMPPLLKIYAFEEMLKTYEALRAKCTKPESNALLDIKIFGVDQLIAFKKQLIADINAAPYAKNDLVTRSKVTMTYSLEKATPDKLIFIKRVGDSFSETETNWTDFAATQLTRLAEHYAMVASKQNPAPAGLAERYLALAVFCKFYELKKETIEPNARQAVRLQPTLKAKAVQFFGPIFE